MPAYYEFRSVEMDRVGCGKRKVLKPPGGGSSDIFGTADLKPAAGTKSNHSDHFSSGSGFGGDLSDMGVKGSSIDSNDGASTPSQTSTSNGSPNNSEPNTPRSGTPLLNGPIAYANQQPLPTPVGRQQGNRARGNPVTGEGYSAEAAEKKEETPRRGRVPPGGYSSKLW
ncbi:microtubule-associated protein Jupiter [Daphnia magna]|uniref:microtubule-associated protein Jupiter n=1 Tax=Daphnia magna TaxID=35525 RepID=UPI0006DD7537|nr:microtubule-associated protein Jupiter [Daphnia magna]